MCEGKSWKLFVQFFDRQKNQSKQNTRLASRLEALVAFCCTENKNLRHMINSFEWLWFFFFHSFDECKTWFALSTECAQSCSFSFCRECLCSIWERFTLRHTHTHSCEIYHLARSQSESRIYYFLWMHFSFAAGRVFSCYCNLNRSRLFPRYACPAGRRPIQKRHSITIRSILFGRIGTRS